MFHFAGLLIALGFMVFGIHVSISEGFRLFGEIENVPGNKIYMFPGFSSFIVGLLLFVFVFVDGYIKEVKLVKCLLSVLVMLLRTVNKILYFIMDKLHVFFPSKIKRSYRFVRLKNWAMERYEKGLVDELLMSMINELLDLSKEYKESWNYGNAVHWAHTIKGLVFIDNGEFEKAKDELIMSAIVSPTPQLRTFGPKMILAEKCKEKFGDKLVKDFLKKFKKSMEKEK